MLNSFTALVISPVKQKNEGQLFLVEVAFRWTLKCWKELMGQSCEVISGMKGHLCKALRPNFKEDQTLEVQWFRRDRRGQQGSVRGAVLDKLRIVWYLMLRDAGSSLKC